MEKCTLSVLVRRYDAPICALPFRWEVAVARAEARRRLSMSVTFYFATTDPLRRGLVVWLIRTSGSGRETA
jgi:hypothetical protein